MLFSRDSPFNHNIAMWQVAVASVHSLDYEEVFENTDEIGQR